jgi:hypothetical protein
MTCDEIRALLATRRQITFAQERAVRAHLVSCTGCATTWQREERIMERFRALPLPSGELTLDTKRAIRTALTASRRLRWQPIYRMVLISVVLVVLLAVSLFPPYIRNYLTAIVGSDTYLVASPTTPIATPTPASAGTLYIASYVTDANAQTIVGARVTAIDLANWQERFHVDGGDEVTLSPDPTRLYVAGTIPGSTNSDGLRAIDVSTGREVWRIPIKYRAAYPGQSNLVVSPDGYWLYLRSYDPTRARGDAVTVPFWLQIIDTTTGRIVPTTIPLPNIGECGAPTLASPPVGHAIYISCYNDRIVAINTQTQQIEPLLLDEVNGAILAPNGHEMYAVNATLGVFVLDSIQRRVLQKTTMRPNPPFSSSHGLVALSGDGKRLVAGQTIEGIPGTDTACEIRVLDRRSGEEVGRFRYEKPLHSFVVDQTGKTLYAVIGQVWEDKTIVEFDLPSGKVRAERSRPKENITQIFLGR